LKHVHPGLTQTTVRCTSCGKAFTIRSTRSAIVVDVCSNCHPAYTGIERATRSGSRIERGRPGLRRKDVGELADQDEPADQASDLYENELHR
jgi:large subunit ribosomal protein L31